MSDRPHGSNADTRHQEAAADFVERVEESGLDGVRRLILFGSVARGTHTPDSDVDVLAVLDGADEHDTEEALRDLAYDTMLEYGTVFSIHAVSETTLERRNTHPFFRRVLDEGQPIYG